MAKILQFLDSLSIIVYIQSFTKKMYLLDSIQLPVAMMKVVALLDPR